MHTHTYTHVCILYFNHIHPRYLPLLCSLPAGLLSFLSSPSTSLPFKKNLDSAYERNTQYSSDADLLCLTWWVRVPVHSLRNIFFLISDGNSIAFFLSREADCILWLDCCGPLLQLVCVCQYLYDTLGHSGVMLLSFLVRHRLRCLYCLFSTKFLLQILRNYIAVRLCLLGISETAPIKSHQHNCPNVSWARTTPLDVLSWREKSPQGLNLMQRTTGNWV